MTFLWTPTTITKCSRCAAEDVLCGMVRGAPVCDSCNRTPPIATPIAEGVTLLCSDCNEYRAERDEARKELADKLGGMRDSLETLRAALADEEKRTKDAIDAKDRNIAIAIDASRRCDAAEGKLEKLERESAALKKDRDTWKDMATSLGIDFDRAKRERDDMAREANRLSDLLATERTRLGEELRQARNEIAKLTPRARSFAFGGDMAATSGFADSDRTRIATDLERARIERIRLLVNVVETMSDDEGETALICGFIREELES